MHHQHNGNILYSQLYSLDPNQCSLILMEPLKKKNYMSYMGKYFQTCVGRGLLNEHHSLTHEWFTKNRAHFGRELMEQRETRKHGQGCKKENNNEHEKLKKISNVHTNHS